MIPVFSGGTFQKISIYLAVKTQTNEKVWRETESKEAVIVLFILHSFPSYYKTMFCTVY